MLALTHTRWEAESGARSLMTDESSEGAATASDGTPKKELSNDQLKAYIHKARAKIRKLEEQNKASAVDAGRGCRRGVTDTCLLPLASVRCLLCWYCCSRSVSLFLPASRSPRVWVCVCLRVWFA